VFDICHAFDSRVRAGIASILPAIIVQQYMHAYTYKHSCLHGWLRNTVAGRLVPAFAGRKFSCIQAMDRAGRLTAAVNGTLRRRANLCSAGAPF
jgi:hypothetical protein